MADLLAFLEGLFRHWSTRLTTGFLAVILLLYGAIVGSLPPRVVVLPVLAAYFLLAAFFAWKEEHRKVQELTHKKNRPYFKILRAGVRADGEKRFFFFGLENSGVNTAIGLSTTAITQDQQLDGGANVVTSSMASVYTSSEKFTTEWEFTSTERQAAQYVVCVLIYIDELSEKQFSQSLFHKWDAVGLQLPILSVDEKNKLLERIPILRPILD
jgi:hypothetical protein